MSQWLTTSILFDRHIALEWEEAALPNDKGRDRVERLIFDASAKPPMIKKVCG